MIENAGLQGMIGQTAWHQAANPANAEGLQQAGLAKLEEPKAKDRNETVQDTYEAKNRSVEGGEGEGGGGGGGGPGGGGEEGEEELAEGEDGRPQARHDDGPGGMLDLTA